MGQNMTKEKTLNENFKIGDKVKIIDGQFKGDEIFEIGDVATCSDGRIWYDLIDSNAEWLGEWKYPEELELVKDFE